MYDGMRLTLLEMYVLRPFQRTQVGTIFCCAVTFCVVRRGCKQVHVQGDRFVDKWEPSGKQDVLHVFKDVNIGGHIPEPSHDAMEQYGLQFHCDRTLNTSKSRRTVDHFVR